MIVPAVISLVGALWVQAAAWRGGVVSVRPVTAPPAASGGAPIAVPLAALVALLLFFQLVLRRGIAFG